MDTNALDAIPWRAMGRSAAQTAIVYWLAMFGLRLVGRRAVAETGPQDLVLLLLLSESFNGALVTRHGGFWESIASAATLLATVGLEERVGPLRRWLDGRETEVVRDGVPDHAAMREAKVDEGDLTRAARLYGLPGPECFERMVLGGDGKLTGVVKPEARGPKTG